MFLYQKETVSLEDFGNEFKVLDPLFFLVSWVITSVELIRETSYGTLVVCQSESSWYRIDQPLTYRLSLSRNSRRGW